MPFAAGLSKAISNPGSHVTSNCRLFKDFFFSSYSVPFLWHLLSEVGQHVFQDGPPSGFIWLPWGAIWSVALSVVFPITRKLYLIESGLAEGFHRWCCIVHLICHTGRSINSDWPVSGPLLTRRWLSGLEWWQLDSSLCTVVLPFVVNMGLLKFYECPGPCHTFT